VILLAAAVLAVGCASKQGKERSEFLPGVWTGTVGRGEMTTRENVKVPVTTIRLESGPADAREGKKDEKILGEEAVVVDRYERPVVSEKLVAGKRVRVNGIVTFGSVGDQTGAAMFASPKTVNVLKFRLGGVMEGE
jgi:hypothetical protein